MSTHEEEIRALERTKQFLFDLLDPKTTPKVSKMVRKRASSCLKHYPLMVFSSDSWAAYIKQYGRAKETKVNYRLEH